MHKEFQPQTGTLYIVGTPIGNLSDITLRALDVLRGVGAIYAEDTRVTKKLLDRYEIATPVRSYREAATPVQVEKMADELIARLEAGESVAYVSDAGTPGVSDPGNFLVGKVRAAGYAAEPIPGVSALATLLSVAGTTLTRPLFVGFLPRKKGRQTLMRQLQSALREGVADAVVCYESPYRLVALLEELAAWEAPLTVCVGRELTKMHEEVKAGSPADLAVHFGRGGGPKGECTLVWYLA